VSLAVPGAVLAGAAAAAEAGPVADAVSALVNLGYRRAEAFGAVAHAAQALGPEAGIEALIRAGLKELSA
jgi:Holliday junction DNA helicase RuvA